MAGQLAKRVKLDNLKVPLQVSIRSLANVIVGLMPPHENEQDMDRAKDRLRKSYDAEIDRQSRVRTPYGQLIETMKLLLTDGSEYELYYSNPLAMLHACSSSEQFARFLLNCHGGGNTLGGIVLYFDECTPGARAANQAL